MEISTALSLTNTRDDGDSTSYGGPQPKSTHKRPRPNPVYPRGFRSIPYDRVTVAGQPRLIGTFDQDPPTKPGTILWPTTFNVYDRTHFHWHRKFFVGEHMDQPLYRITSRNKRLKVRHGTSKTDPVIATLVHKSFFGNGSGTVIPPLGHGPAIPLDDKYSFSCLVPTPEGHSTRLEKFEWRRSGGRAVNRLGRRHGYKLVRLATDAGRGGGEVATGGGEVVLVMTRHMAFTWSKAAEIMFQGTGAQGVLGSQWQLVAALTAIGIWDYKRRKETGPAFSDA